MEELIMYIVINKDLPMSVGKTAAQAAHVCTEYILKTVQGSKEEKRIMQEWYDQCQKKIVLGAHQNVMEKLAADPRFYPIRDNGYTEIPAGSLTAVCLGVHTKEEIHDVTKRLQLLK